MKILQVVTKSELGGAQTHVWQLSTYLQDKGHAVHITAFPGGWLHDQARAHRVPFHPNTALSNSLDPRQGLRAGREAARLVAHIRPDVVHCHSSAAGFWTRWSVRGSTPTVFTAHGWGFMPGAPILRRVALLVAERLVTRYTSRYICVSARDGRMAARYGIAPRDKVEVIHNGVEPSETAAQKPSPDTVIRMMFVGRLARPKEPELLLAALTELPASVRNAYQLQIVGDGPLLPALRRLASMTSTKAQFLGPLAREEVLRRLADSHVFVLTSRYEGLPLSILEAMGAGLAVIASDVGGVGEAVTAECGILVPSGDKEALKLALTRFAEDRAAIARYGAAASERARRVFSKAEMCAKTLAVYESVRPR